jgi:hypothetical protein
MIIETCELEGDVLEAAVTAVMGNRGEEATPNERHLLMESAGHYSRRNPDAPTRDHPHAHIACIDEQRWVAASSPLVAIKRAYVLRQRPDLGTGPTTQDGPGPFRPT